MRKCENIRNYKPQRKGRCMKSQKNIRNSRR